jgi:PAS domain S-box-containing protein
MAAKRLQKKDDRRGEREAEAPTAPEETRALQEKLQASELRYRRLFETAQDGILLLNAKTGQITDVNPFLLDLLGYPYEEIAGKKLWEIGPFVDRAAARQAFKKLQKDGYIRYENLPLETATGTRIQVEFVSNAYSVGSEKVIQCNIRDVTQRKVAEHVAQGRNQGKDFALDVGELGAWRLDLATGTAWRSPQHDQIFGYPALLPEWTYEMFLGHVLAEERDAVAESFDKALSGNTDWDFTCRIRRKDGEVRWIWAKGRPECDERGEPVAMYGLVQDITERKVAEASLAESELKYRQVVENATEAIFVAQHGRIVFLNPATSAMIGHSSEEIMARPFTEFVHPDDQDMVLERHYARTRGEEPPSAYAFRVVGADGAIRWGEVKVVLIDWQGKPASLGLLSDVTARKEAEEELGRSLESTLNALSRATERRDPYTAGHQQRVTELAVAIARKLGYSDTECGPLRIAGMLHDIGKATIPTEILSKPSTLSPIEFELVRTHPQAAYEIIGDVSFPGPVAEIVLQHHERLDGSGYPRGLAGEQLLREARILGVADVVEAMASHRPYRPALGIDVALEEIRAGRGTRYDAEVADVCVRLFESGEFSFSQAPKS